MKNLQFYILSVFCICVFIGVLFFGLLFSILFMVWGKITHDNRFFKYGFNIAVSIDQLGNVIMLGDPDETISSRLGRAILSGRPKWFVPGFAALVDFIFYKLDNQESHCINSIEHEKAYDSEIWSWIK